MTNCNECSNKENCPFYEKDSEECVYDAMAQYAQWAGEQMRKEKEEGKIRMLSC
jgi:hypothetical protein